MISTRGRYALRVMIDLAEHIDEGYIPLQTIAKRQGISEKYLESILAVLSKAGLLDAVRGKGGGYRLSKPAKEYTAFEVLSLTEGTLWQGLDQVIAAYLCSYTLADLTREEKPQPKRRRTKT